MKNDSKLKDLYFDVEKVNLEELFPKYKFSPNKRFGIIAKDNHIVNTCSAQYGLVSNFDLLEPLLKELEGNFGKHVEIQKATNRNNSAFYIDFIINQQDTQIGKTRNVGDIVNPRVRWTNSYDGSTSHEVSFGAYRLVCTNGMTLPVFDKHIKLRHSTGIGARAARDTVQGIQEFVDKFKDLTEGYSILSERKIGDIDARIEEITNETKFPQRQMEYVQTRVRSEAKTMGAPVTDWLIYNGFNFQLNHNEAIKVKEHKKEKQDSTILNYILENPYKA